MSALSSHMHWLCLSCFQEHHFEISSRTIAYIDLSRVLRGNETLHVHSSPILNSVARKAIARVVTHADSSSVSQPNPSEEEKEVEGGWRNGSAAIYFSSLVTSDEPSFAFLNLGIPFFRISVSNSPKVRNLIWINLNATLKINANEGHDFTKNYWNIFIQTNMYLWVGTCIFFDVEWKIYRLFFTSFQFHV